MLPVGWLEVSSEKDSKVLVMSKHENAIYAKIKFISFTGDLSQLDQKIHSRIIELGVLDTEYGTIMVNNIKWETVRYVCGSEDMKYRACFYAVIDKGYVMFELMTDSCFMQTQLHFEAKRLISCIDYSTVVHDNAFVCCGRAFSLKTPLSFRLSPLSSDARLIFLSSSKFLVVNIQKHFCSLEESVKSQISLNYLGMKNCSVEIDGVGATENGIEWVRYAACDAAECIGFGTYFQQRIEEAFIVSYLFEETGPTVDLSNFLVFRSDENEFK